MRGRPAEPSTRPATDAELISACRAEDPDAYGKLFERHADAARRLAELLTCDEQAAGELVTDASDLTHAELLRDDGVDLAFRPYLLGVIRDVAHQWSQTGRRILLSTQADTALDTHSDALATDAFGRMPERWRVALWHTEVEGDSPEFVAELLGLSPAGADKLIQRALDGLRRLYLEADFDDDPPEDCRAHRDLMAESARGRLPRRRQTALDEHLDGCARCRSARDTLAAAESDLSTLIGTAVLGPFTAAYARPQVRHTAAPEPARRRVRPLAAAVAGVAVVVVAGSAFAVVNSISGPDDAGTNRAAAAPTTPYSTSSAPHSTSAAPTTRAPRTSHTPTASRTHHAGHTSRPHASTTRSRTHASNTPKTGDVPQTRRTNGRRPGEHATHRTSDPHTRTPTHGHRQHGQPSESQRWSPSGHQPQDRSDDTYRPDDPQSPRDTRPNEPTDEPGASPSDDSDGSSPDCPWWDLTCWIG